MAAGNDSVKKTIFVAVILCVVCSVMVSTAAVALKERQEQNKAIDKKKNVLEAAGQKVTDPAEIEKVFGELIETRVVDLETGELLDPAALDVSKFDQKKVAKDPASSIELTQAQDLGGIKRRENRSLVYLIKEAGVVTKVILPVNGKGLWGTMYGFVTLGRVDGSTGDFGKIHALVFYEHVETPGLGGEVENERWKALWNGKLVKDADGVHQIRVIKGSADPSNPHEVDGLSGATITSRGVTNLLKFWLGEDGFGHFLSKLSQGE